jgi:hypothetical protein
MSAPFAPASVQVRPDHVRREVVVVLINGGEAVELRLSPEQGLELGLRLAANVARLLGVDR